jgi:hypothetical protein
VQRIGGTDQAVRRRLKRLGAIGAVAALSLAASASSAMGAVTIGQLDPGTPAVDCLTARDRVQPAVNSGSTYVVPNTGGVTDWTLTSWSHKARTGAGQTLGMKVFRKVANPATFSVVAHDNPRPLTPSTINTFPVNIPVKAGDFLGEIQTNAAVSVSCSFAAAGDPGYIYRDGNLTDGTNGAFTSPGFPGFRLNISAVVTPTNSFTVGTVKRNKKKGTATLTLNVPNPGSLAVGGKGVKPANATAGAAGDVTVTIKAKGKKRSKLNANGKVTVTPAITFTPNGGDAGTQSPSVKLKKIFQ